MGLDEWEKPRPASRAERGPYHQEAGRIRNATQVQNGAEGLRPGCRESCSHVAGKPFDAKSIARMVDGDVRRCLGTCGVDAG